MILLKGKSLDPSVKFTPESMELTLADSGVSTAEMTLGPDAPEIGLGDWLKDDTEPGKGIVWRVRSVSTSYDTDTRTVQLEHIVATLQDGLIFGEKDPSDIAGKKAEKVSAKTAVQYVLSKQSYWKLGSFEYSRSLPYSFNNATNYAAIESVCSTLEDSRWEYDLSALPFRLSIVRKDPGNLGTEMRAGRNLKTISRTVDMTGMYTRFYPVGVRNMHISGGYVSKNEDLYGVIAHTETNQSKKSKDMLKEWALHRLRRHCEPTVTITIKGLDLSRATGEPLDSLTLGRVCRVPLPEFGTTIREYIVRLSWSDKIKAPEDVTVTLSNHRTDATSNLAKTLQHLATSGGANAGGGAAAAEEDHAWIVDTTDKVGLVAESIVGRDPTGKEVDWSRVSEIIVDGEGIHQRVTATQDELIVAESRIEMNENGIRLESERATAEEGKLSGRLSVTAEAITAEVTRATAAEDTLSGRLSVTAEAITAEVTRATAAEGTLSTRITQTADKVSVIATDEDIESFIESGGTGSMLSVTKDQITSAVGRIGVAEGNISTITGSALWQNRDSVTAAAGKLVVSGNKLRLVDGASLEIKRNGVYQTVGTVDYTDEQISAITGSALWQNRDSIAAAAGKLSVDRNGNLVVEEGAELKVYSDGTLRSVSALAGKVTLNGAGNVLIKGADLIVQDSNEGYHNVTTVAGKFSVDSSGNVRLQDGAELKVYSNGTLRSINALAGKVTLNGAGNVLIKGADLIVQDSDEGYHNVTAVAGKFSVDSSGNVRLQDGAELKVYSDGTLSSINALAGKVTVRSDGGVQVNGAGLYIKDNAGTVSSISQVTGKFTVTNAGNVKLEDGAGFFIQRNGASIQVVDKGNVITAIRTSAEGVQIQASKVDLGDYATVTALDAVNASITNLTSGFTTADLLVGKTLTGNYVNVQLNQGFKIHNKLVEAKQKTFVTGVTLTKPSLTKSANKNFMFANTYHGEYSGTQAGCVVTDFSAGSLSVSTATHYFLIRED